ncbi:MAG: hypothetical protein FWD57_14505, partial [Polyangiaceae bacterium]|nr:hypothetical protein [Polyangiaceae bacterium]
VMDTMLEHVFGLSRSAVATVDRLSRFYVLWRFTYQESSIESGDAIVFCYPQGISMDGPDGIAGPLPRLVEKVKSTYRVRTFQERGSIETLGIARDDGTVAPLVDVLHRLLWLIENGPRQIPAFLKRCQVNLEQLRAVAEAIQGPKTRRNDSWGGQTPELSTLSKLTANWNSVTDGAVVGEERDDQSTGQLGLSLSGGRGRRKAR